jgi:succinate-semialdehyde dehydrogenase/glutarate-semialdehyde dehydrogenase
MQSEVVTRPEFDALQVERLLGHIVASPGAHATTQRSPLDLEPTVTVSHSSEADVERAFATAREAQPQWAGTPARERSAVIDRFHDLLFEEESALCDAIQWENGKARTHAADEVLYLARVCRYYARTAPGLLKPKRRLGAFPLITRVKELRQPKGVVGVISPWNYPLCVGVADLVPALLAGNAVVWKPDVQVMLTACMAVDLLREAGLPEGILQVVAGEGPLVGPMVVDRADFVMFTGSTATGRTVAQRAAHRLVDVSLELGGKNACIVLPDADIDKAVDIALRGAFANTGQLCIGTERIVVHESIERAFTDAFVEAVERLALGPIIGWGSDMGPLISQPQLARTQQHVQDAIDKGATVLTGGRARPDLGPLMYAPTVLADVSDEMVVCCTETFGPVCSLDTWSDEDVLVDYVNGTGYGLSAAIVTKDIANAKRLATRLRVGAVNINESFGSAFASVDVPMGGMGESGIGRRHGAQGLLKYTEAQAIASQHWLPLAPGRFSDQQWARLAGFGMRLFKKLRMR